MNSQLLAWLPSLAASAAVLGVAALAIGIWRTWRQRPRGALLGPVVSAFGLVFLLVGWAGHTQYHISHKGRLDYCRSTLVKSIATALEMYATDHDGQLPAKLSELTPTYLKHLPLCPAAGRDTYSEAYFRILTFEGVGYRVSCGGHNHEGAGVSGPDMPSFHSGIGSY